MKNFKVYLTLFAVFLLTTSIIAQEKYSAIIKGRVVDENGRPVVGVNVRFDNSEALRDKLCWVKDNSVFSDADGQFLHQEYCTVEQRTVYLLMAPTIGFEYAQTPIYPPFWTDLRRTNPRFAGVPVKINGNEQIDLGNIPLQVWYNPIEIFVTDKLGRPFYKTDDDWARFVLIIRDEHGLAVGSEGLSVSDLENSVRIDRGSVRLALPEGTWIIELLRDWDDFDMKGRTLRKLATTDVVVSRTDVCLQATLKVQ